MIREFYTPSTISEAVELKKKFGDQITYYAGGTHINYAPTNNQITKVIGLGHLNLTHITEDNEAVNIEAGVTLQQLIDSELAPKTLREACGLVITRNIRNMATIGGNIAAQRNDSPVIPYLIACGAQLEMDDQKQIGVENYIENQNNGLIVKVVVPKTKGSFSVKRVSRTANGLTILSTAVKIERDQGNISNAIIVVGGLEGRIFRLKDIEGELVNSQFSEPDKIEQKVASLVQPKSDFMGSSQYKRYISGVTVVDSIKECLEKGEVS